MARDRPCRRRSYHRTRTRLLLRGLLEQQLAVDAVSAMSLYPNVYLRYGQHPYRRRLDVERTDSRCRFSASYGGTRRKHSLYALDQKVVRNTHNAYLRSINNKRSNGFRTWHRLPPPKGMVHLITRRHHRLLQRGLPRL